MEYCLKSMPAEILFIIRTYLDVVSCILLDFALKNQNQFADTSDFKMEVIDYKYFIYENINGNIMQQSIQFNGIEHSISKLHFTSIHPMKNVMPKLKKSKDTLRHLELEFYKKGNPETLGFVDLRYFYNFTCLETLVVNAYVKNNHIPKIFTIQSLKVLVLYIHGNLCGIDIDIDSKLENLRELYFSDKFGHSSICGLDKNTEMKKLNVWGPDVFIGEINKMTKIEDLRIQIIEANAKLKQNSIKRLNVLIFSHCPNLIDDFDKIESVKIKNVVFGDFPDELKKKIRKMQPREIKIESYGFKTSRMIEPKINTDVSCLTFSSDGLIQKLLVLNKFEDIDRMLSKIHHKYSMETVWFKCPNVVKTMIKEEPSFRFKYRINRKNGTCILVSINSYSMEDIDHDFDKTKYILYSSHNYIYDMSSTYIERKQYEIYVNQTELVKVKYDNGKIIKVKSLVL